MKTADDLIKLINKKVPDNVVKTGAGMIANTPRRGIEGHRTTMLEASRMTTKTDEDNGKTIDVDLLNQGRFTTTPSNLTSIIRAVEKGWNEARFRVPKIPEKIGKTKITPITTIRPEGEAQEARFDLNAMFRDPLQVGGQHPGDDRW